VLQEALQNAVKYSGVRQFAVELRGTEEEIQLTVTDSGVGFDPHEAINGHGLGLISMRERLYLAAGRFLSSGGRAWAPRSVLVCLSVPGETPKGQE
jgi:signal transduction histidine kinase